MITGAKKNQINLLSVLCLFILTHFIYTDFLISQIYAFVLMAILVLANIVFNKGKVRVYRTDFLVVYLGIVITLFLLFPGARRDNDTISFAISIIAIGLIVLAMSPTEGEIFKAFKLVKIGSALIAAYVIFCSVFKSVYLNIILPHLSSEVQIRGARLLKYGYGVPMGASAVFADYVFSLCLFIIFADYLVNKWTRRQKVTNIFLMGVLVIGMFVEGRRGEPIAAIITMFIQVLFTMNAKKKKQFVKIMNTVLVALLAMIALMIILQAAGVLERFMLTFVRIQANFRGASIDITSGRIVLWSLAISLFKSSPLLGIGWGNYANFAPVINGEDVAEAHNNYLQVLCESGIVGFILIIVPIIIVYVDTIRVLRKLSNGANNCGFARVLCSISFSIQSFFMILGFIDPSFYKGIFWAIFSIAICFYGIAKNETHALGRTSRTEEHI